MTNGSGSELLKGKDQDPDQEPNPDLRQMDPDPEGPKTSGSPTLVTATNSSSPS
jgi:hypothetical protein